MKEYKFPDPENEGYEIIVPSTVTRDIIINYLQKTYYWSVAIGSGMIGFLLGVLAS
jgi:hypothetical protein